LGKLRNAETKEKTETNRPEKRFGGGKKRHRWKPITLEVQETKQQGGDIPTGGTTERGGGFHKKRSQWRGKKKREESCHLQGVKIRVALEGETPDRTGSIREGKKNQNETTTI